MAPDRANAAKSASLVIDANSGRVLHDRAASARRYPASLTKLMTLYLVFERIERGEMSYRTMITASPRAAAKPPSKIGLHAGDQISVRDAVAALIVKSANDVATAVAEHIAGSEARFAKLMTRKARELGMTNTVFRNASGLPHPAQVTTAIDMARLAMALHDHFPRHYSKFKLLGFTYRGRRFRTHNAITRSFPGAEGLKTGYIRASGFNIVSVVRRGRKHVIAVVFGGRSGRSRNRLARLLLSRGLSQASRRVTRAQIPRSLKPVLVAKPRQSQRPRRRIAARPAPTSRQQPRLAAARPSLIGWGRRRQPRRIASAVPTTVSAAPAERPRTISIARVRTTSVLPAAPRNAAPPKPKPSQSPASIGDLIRRMAQPGLLTANNEHTVPKNDRIGKLVRMLRGPRPVTARPQATTQPPTTTPARPAQSRDGGFQIQVGAYLTQNEAQRQLARVQIAGGDLLSGSRGLTPTVSAGNRTLYRARFAGFDAKAASQTCESLRAQGIDCHVARVQ